MRSKENKAVVKETIQKTMRELGKKANIHLVLQESNAKLPKTLRITTGTFYQYLRVVHR